MTKVKVFRQTLKLWQWLELTKSQANKSHCIFNFFLLITSLDAAESSFTKA